jgi:tetratricopeptide (TPR) repeat protein
MLTRFIIAAIGCYTTIAPAHEAIDVQIEHINTLLKSTPENRTFFIKRGELHRQHGNHPLALRDFQHAKKINSSSGDTDFYIGRLRLEMNQADKALPMLRRFIHKNPGHSNALQYLGDAHFALDHFVLAARAYKQAATAEKHPDPELFLKTVRAYEEAGPDYKKHSRKAIEQGILRLGPLVTLIMTGIQLEISQQDYAQALGLLEKLPEAVKNSPKWMLRHGEILNKAGHKKEAILVNTRAIEKINNLPNSRRNSREMIQIINALKSNLKPTQTTTSKGS